MGAAFLAVYALLYLAYFFLPDADLKRVHDAFILQPCAAVLNHVLGATVSVSDNGLVSEGIYLRIVRGCDGAGVLFFLLAAIGCFPARAAVKFGGLLGALMLVHILNVARIVVLYFVFKDQRDLFSDLHNLYLPTAMLLICGLAFMLWSNVVQVPRIKPS